MKAIIAILILLLFYLQFKLWIGDGGIPDVLQLQEQLDQASQQKQTLQERNNALAAEVRDLKTGLDAIEERARSELGMVGENETFYHIVKPTKEEQDGLTNSDTAE